MAKPSATIYILDDDKSVRAALSRLLRYAGFATQSFASVDALLASGPLRTPSCIVADLRMPGGGGLVLRDQGVTLPVIIVTAHDTEEMREQARQAGIFSYFRKPIDDQALIDSIEWALGNSQSPFPPTATAGVKQGQR